MCDIGVTSVTVWSHISQSQVTQSHNKEKIIKDFRTDNIIQYSNCMLVLWRAYEL